MRYYISNICIEYVSWLGISKKTDSFFPYVWETSFDEVVWERENHAMCWLDGITVSAQIVERISIS